VAGGSIVSRRRAEGEAGGSVPGPDLARPSAVAAEPVP